MTGDTVAGHMRRWLSIYLTGARQLSNYGGAVGVLFVIAVVAVVVIPWHVAHQHVPTWDGAGYVLVAQKIAQSFDQGFISGITAFYLERLWRPIIFPAIAAPFFIMSSGNILVSITMTELMCALIAGLYVYFFLRGILGPLRATIGVTFIVSLAWFVTYTHIYFHSEPFWLGATAGVMFHLTAGLRTKRPWHFVAGGIWLGLMVAVRPAETVVLAALPVGTLLVWAYRSGIISASDLLAFAFQVCAVVGAVVFKLFQVNDALVYLLLFVAMTVVVLRARSFFFESPVLAFIILAEIVSIGWHLPTIRMLYDWAYASSFGQWAQLSDQRFSGLSFIAIVRALLQYYSPIILVIIATVVLVTVAGWRRGNDFFKQSAIPLIVISAAMLAIFPILVMHLLSGTSDERRIMPAMFLLYVGLTALALLPWGYFSRIRLASVAILAALQLTSVVANGFLIQSPAVERLQKYTGFLREPDISPDANIAVVDGILPLGIRSGFVIAYSHCLMGTNSCVGKQMPIFEHVAVSTIATERRLPINVHYFGDLDLSRPETLAKQIHERGVRYVLVDMFDESDFPEIDHTHPVYQHTQAFIRFAREGFPTGFTKLGCFTSLRRPICAFTVKS